MANLRHSVLVVNRRALFAGAGMVLLILLLLLRLGYLQIIKADHYATLSQNNRLKVIAVAPPRGLIFSREGELLADNRPSFALVLDTGKVRPIDATVAELRELLQLRDEQLETFRGELRSRGRVNELTLISRLTERQVAVFSVNAHRFPGVRIDARLSRFYPDSRYWAHLIGYIGRISEQDLTEIDAANYRASTHIGKTGIERTYERILHGSVGYRQVEVNAQGRELRVLEETPPRPGHDIYLTVDASLQRLALDALGDRRGAIVALEPATGAVLALVSTPSYDTNPFVDGISSAAYAALRGAPDRPLYNRALQGLYPPGSTIKPVFALAGLDGGYRTPTTRTPCPGWYQLPDSSRIYHDWEHSGHGQVDLKRALAESCDVYFYALARDIGITRLVTFARQFGFGVPTGIDLPGESSGLFPSPEWKRKTHDQPWYPGDTLNVGIGQGYTLVTPLQLAFATAVLARRGHAITPHVAGQIEDPLVRVAVEPHFEDRLVVRLRAEEHWDEAIAGMEEVVHGTRGTARRTAADATYRYAGKSGTAQVFTLAQDLAQRTDKVAAQLQDHAWFIAFAPVQDPQIAVAVLVEHGGGGSSVAAPIVRRLLDHHLLGASAPPDAEAAPATLPEDADGGAMAE
ncbi:MAG: penicillin-binding protein 2 [Gammaproteobacteria bacterium]|nr:penicillin-binding protein 2 [Gammaproteobacteria bacterium]